MRRRRRRKPTRAELEAAGQLELAFDQTMDQQATSRTVRAKANRLAHHRRTRDDQLLLRLFVDLNAELSTVENALNTTAETLTAIEAHLAG